jgi:hypothetical protein
MLVVTCYKRACTFYCLEINRQKVKAPVYDERMKKCDAQNRSRSPITDNFAWEGRFATHDPFENYPDTDTKEAYDERDDYTVVGPFVNRTSPG